MSIDPNKIKDIFLKAVEQCEPGKWSDFLDSNCEGDANLRRRVEDLLEAHLGKDSLLDTPKSESNNTIEHVPTEGPGTVIGPYKLLQEIGHGGMGMVFMAEQHEPVRRKVALKIIKPGMDSRQVLARFEAERQALSLMDHPNIAKVLDAGTTSSGRPFFVMELVKGQPITQYCDENKLTPRQRLELLLPVCHAIQHAHQKGIIHRDIKPSNILVAEYDQKPVPKVIDFGVAKATSQPLTDKTMFTGFGQVVGTLEYMSPEQAKVNQLDIDTRSDIYSLGVLMYELLTGSTPFDRKRLKKAAWDEMLRIIREEDPPKPSTRLFDSKDSLPSISAQRHTEPAKLTKLVRGELDWIVMKALEKDRCRRYETANGMAMDLLRYLNDEAVSACPPSTGYRFSKFVKRNRPQMIAASLILLALIFGIIGTSWGLLRARAERDDKEVARQEAEENYQRTRQVVDDFFTLVSQNTIFNVPGLQPVRRDLLKKARDYYQETYKKRPDDPALLAGLTVAQLRLAAVYFEIDRADDWLMLFAQGVENASRLKTQFPTNREAHRKVVGFWPGLRRMQGQQAMPKDLQLADDTIKRYLALWSQFAQENPEELRFQRDLAIGYGLLGVTSIALSDLDGQKRTHAWNAARNWLDQCIQTFETVLQRAPQDTSCRELLIEALGEQAFLATLLKRPKDREILQAKADQHSEQLATENVKIPLYREYLIAKTMRPLNGQIDSGHLKEAEATIQKASQLLSDLVTEQPGTANYGTLRLRLLEALLQVRQKANQPIEIEPQLEQLIATCKSRLKAWPELPVMLHEMTEVLRFAAGYAHERGRTEVAEAHLLELKTVIQSYKLPMENEVDHNERVGSWYLFQLSQFYHDAGKQAERAGALQQAATIFQELTRHKSPRTSLHWRRLAESQRELGQYDLALESINQSLALHARNNDAYHFRGDIYQKLQQNVKAIEDYSKALENDQDNEWTWANRAWCRLQLGQLESAAADYRKAIELKPKSPNFHSVLGDVLMKLGRKEEAVNSHQRAWELEPGNETYKKKLAEIQANLKEKKRP